MLGSGRTVQPGFVRPKFFGRVWDPKTAVAGGSHIRNPAPDGTLLSFMRKLDKGLYPTPVGKVTHAALGVLLILCRFFFAAKVNILLKTASQARSILGVLNLNILLLFAPSFIVYKGI